MGVNLGVGDLAHASAQGIAKEQALIDYSLALEVLVTRKGEGLPYSLCRVVK